MGDVRGNRTDYFPGAGAMGYSPGEGAYSVIPQFPIIADNFRKQTKGKKHAEPLDD